MPTARFLAGRLYGRATYEPKYIALQIWCIQLIYYTSLVTLILLAASVLQFPRSPDVITNPERISISGTEGRITCCIYLSNSIITGLAIDWIVDRSRQCLDFAVTVGFIHMVLVTIMHGLPNNLGWWLLLALSILLCGIIAERLSRRKETQDLQFDFIPDEDDDTEPSEHQQHIELSFNNDTVVVPTTSKQPTGMRRSSLQHEAEADV